MLRKKLGTEAIKKDWNSCNNLKNYFKIPSTLIIPESCEKIGQYTFFECMNLKKVVISESCKRIGDGAFKNCGTLKKVVIPRSVEWIGDYAFEWCWKTTIILKKHKKNFEHIGADAFDGCKVC